MAVALPLVWRHGLVLHPSAPWSVGGVLALVGGYAVLLWSFSDRKPGAPDGADGPAAAYR